MKIVRGNTIYQMRQSAKKYIIKIIAWAFLPLLLLHFFITDSGFCYTDMRYLSEREIVDGALFGKESNKLTFEKKVSIMKARNGAAYPNNCRIMRQAEPTSFSEKVRNALFASKLYNVDCISSTNIVNSPNSKELSDWNSLFANACGTYTAYMTGTSISKDFYESEVKRNKQYWQEKINDNNVH